MGAKLTRGGLEMVHFICQLKLGHKAYVFDQSNIILDVS